MEETDKPLFLWKLSKQEVGGKTMPQLLWLISKIKFSFKGAMDIIERNWVSNSRWLPLFKDPRFLVKPDLKLAHLWKISHYLKSEGFPITWSKLASCQNKFGKKSFRHAAFEHGKIPNSQIWITQWRKVCKIKFQTDRGLQQRHVLRQLSLNHRCN